TMSVKAFKLVSAVEREMLMGDKNYINIECIECCGKNLYIGTNDCFIYHFMLDEKVSAAGKITFAATKQLHKYLGLKKPVSELKAASALTRLLVLCDNTITLVNMINLEPVPSGARIKGAVTFTLNENPVSGDPFCVEVCIISVKRRTIQMFMVFEDRVQIVKEVFTPEQPCAVAVDGYYLCLALTTQYIILNYNTGVSQDLFPYCSDEKRPIVKRIGRQEFLLAGPGGLGMFATVDGISQRAPVHWSENVIGAALCFPYVVALDDEFITVHSMLDQQQKQTLPFKEGHILQDFEGKVIVATNKGVYILVPLPLEKQIQDLLASHRVEEALVLAKGARRNIPKEKFQVMYKRILQQAGFIQFAQLQFLEAKELFRLGTDRKDLNSVYSQFLPATSTFCITLPAERTTGDSQSRLWAILSWKLILLESYFSFWKQIIIEARVCEVRGVVMVMLPTSSYFLDGFGTVSMATSEQRRAHPTLQLPYNSMEGMSLLVRIFHTLRPAEICCFGYFWVIICFFLEFIPIKVVKRKSLSLGREVILAVKIRELFAICKKKKKQKTKSQKNPNNLLRCLSAWTKDFVINSNEKEKYHTHLAVLYLEAITQLKSETTDNCTETTELLFKLRSLLQKSDLYRIRFILDKIQGTDLHMESAILYGKLEEHEKALHILVHELKDFHAAEEYCIWNSENRDMQYRRRLFHMLLSVYLTPGTSDCALVMAAVDLLNNHAAEFDAGLVLQVVPDSWSVQLLSPFLTGAVRQSIHTKRMTQVALGLAQAENLIYKHEKVKQRGTPILLSDKKVCQVCQNPFCEPVFVRYPNGSVVHTHCAANRHLNSNVTHHSSSSSNQT
ncbi:Transforming growth factor-beta receptor-associated protein 1, partial [Manacus vitellinus]